MELKYFPNTSPEIYHARERRRGYTVMVSPIMLPSTTAGAIVARRLAGWSRESHCEAATHYALEALRLDALWSKTADLASLETFGRPYNFPFDYKISGIAREEFSVAHKEILRDCASGVTNARLYAAAHLKASRYARRYEGS